MTDLLIDRLHARAAVTGPDDEARVRALLADLTGHRLEDALAGVALPEGDWCLRRLDVWLRLDAFSADSALGRRWAQSVTDAIADAVCGTGPHVVHYPRRLDAVIDVVAALAVGDRSREWAWRSVGALTSADPDPASSPTQAALAALARDPAAAVHAISAAVGRVGLPALHRLFGESGWRAVAAIVLAAAGHAPRAWLDGSGGGTAPEGTASDGATHGGATRGGTARGGATGAGASDALAADPDGARPGQRSSTAPDTPAAPLSGLARASAGADGTVTVAAARSIAEGILARSAFAQAWRSNRLRPGAATARAWTLLAAAEVEPALLRRPIAAATLALLPATVTGDPPPASAARLPVAAPTAAPPDGPATGRAPASAASPASAPAERPDSTAPEPSRVATTGEAGTNPIPGATPGPVGAPDRETATAPGTPDSARYTTGSPTAYGGLVYLLATAGAAGIPDDLIADDALADRPLPWSLFQVHRRLCAGLASGRPTGAAPTDPALFALAGLAIGPWPEPEPTAAQAELLDHHAARWAAVTAARLGAGGEDPVAMVAGLTARDGWVEAAPGWVEFRLRLDDVDLAVRRAGLDIDPGYLQWLGAVVVIRYG